MHTVSHGIFKNRGWYTHTAENTVCLYCMNIGEIDLENNSACQ